MMRLTPDKKLHSREHLLAEDLSQMLVEPKKFAAYLGIAQRYEESDLRALSRYVLEKNDLPVAARGKYFFASLKGLTKKLVGKKKIRNVRQLAEAGKSYGREKTKYKGDRQRTGKGTKQRAPQKSG